MSSIISWLRVHKTPALLITIFYFLLVVLPHKWVGHQVTLLFVGVPRKRYDLIILVIILVLLLIIFASIFRKLKQHEEKWKLIFYYIFTIECMILTTRFLFFLNVESVHYFQYGVAVILLFTLFENYFVALIAAFIFALIDEGYQYFYLFPEATNYFDLNDIITDLLGAAFGLLVLKTFKVTESRSLISYKKSFFLPLLILVISFVGLLQTNILSVYPSTDKFMLVKEMEQGFWTASAPPVSIFHVARPVEGLLILIFLFVTYYFCFRSKIAEKN